MAQSNLALSAQPGAQAYADAGDDAARFGPRGIGARLLRNEDARFLAGHGEYLADLNLYGTMEVAFFRSPIAHGRIRSIEIPEEVRSRVFLLSDLGDVRPVRAVLNAPGFRGSDFPPLADGVVRFVGEPIAMCIAPTRAEAEDIAQQIFVDFEELPVVTDMLKAADGSAPSIHDGWPDNVCFVSTPGNGDMAQAERAAVVTIERDLHMHRQCVVSLEGRGVLAHHDRRLDELVVYSSTQQPHIIRTVLAPLIGVEENKLRVVAPDVGGGFGVKNNLQAEEIAIAALARIVDHPVRWIEDRREHLTASPQAREHHYRMKLHADAQGRILGLESEVIVDAGAYSIWPWSCAMEANMSAGIMPGPYRMDAYRGRGITVMSNKPPLGPYRGVGRPGACFALERMMDELARAVGREPHEVRIDNMVLPGQMPFLTIAGKLYDSGDFPESVRRAAEMVDVPGVRARQKDNGKDGLYIGLGLASYTEQTAHGTNEWLSRNLTEVFGYEAATARFTPDGKLILEVAIQNHGQGLETTLAQVAATELGVDPADVVVRHGDTAVSPYGLGTFASRSMVMAGGAVGRATQMLAEKVKRIGAHFLQTTTDKVTLEDGAVVHGQRRVPLSEVTRAAFRHAQDLPPGEEPGLSVTTTFQPESGTGAFSYATHAVVVCVDANTGLVKILDYVIVHDCGTIVNPMIVDGQIQGGLAQGIGNALLEESPYDETGQPLASTFLDYLLPGFTEVPSARISHIVSPSPFTRYGIKGMGEGGAIGAPAAIVNAVNDALHGLGVEINETPVTPRRILKAIERAAKGDRP
ncbi:xanthine dehydrogenase family protein molybdopterin-binding subunit [Aquamicrobium terrae]